MIDKHFLSIAVCFPLTLVLLFIFIMAFSPASASPKLMAGKMYCSKSNRQVKTPSKELHILISSLRTTWPAAPASRRCWTATHIPGRPNTSGDDGEDDREHRPPPESRPATEWPSPVRHVRRRGLHSQRYSVAIDNHMPLASVFPPVRGVRPRMGPQKTTRNEALSAMVRSNSNRLCLPCLRSSTWWSLGQTPAWAYSFILCQQAELSFGNVFPSAFGPEGM